VFTNLNKFDWTDCQLMSWYVIPVGQKSVAFSVHPAYCYSSLL